MTVPVFDDGFHHKLEELIAWRRDVRRFRTTPIDAAAVDHLIRLSCLSPSVGNSQPWRFVLVEDKARRALVRDSFLECNGEALAEYQGERAQLYARLKLAGLDAAPVHLAVFCDRATGAGYGLGRRTMPETLDYSVVSAVHTFWLAARAWGIGVGWVSILDPEAVRLACDAPADWRLIAYLCVGLPEEEHVEPELVRSGWQERIEVDKFLFRV